MIIPQNVTKIMEKLIEAGYEAYVIGGAVRDTILHIEPQDYDIFTNATGEVILSLFSDGKVIGGEERQAKILTVVVDGVEVSQYRKNGERTLTGMSLLHHVNTCDFTINSMIVNINGDIGDPHFGELDIRSELIRCVGDPQDRINEDKLRVFRAVRFAIKYGFTIEDDLAHVIYDTDVSDLPVERIREEVLKILSYPGGLVALDDFGLLRKVIPEFEACYCLMGGAHHNETVDEHMFKAQDLMCGLTDNKALIFAAALHDIGKGVCCQFKEFDGVSFHGHEKVGSGMIRAIMERMKFSNDDIKYVETLIAEHMFGWKPEDLTDKAIIRHFGRMERAGITIEDHIMMMYCDSQANMKNPRVKFGDFIIRSSILIDKYNSLKYSPMPFSVSDLDINGFDVMECGVPKGPDVGIILGSIFEMVINGEIENRRGGLINYVKRAIR